MKYAIDFVRFALSLGVRERIPAGALSPGEMLFQQTVRNFFMIQVIPADILP